MCAAVKTYRIGKFDLNPRGNLWAKDESKFGQKLLSKMGWSEGKGLGKNENGITENIKVRMKIGHSGVGFTEKMPLALESHEYDAVLETLNNKFKAPAVTKTESNLKGLEQRSQQFKNRLHYQKFVRGKDVGRYSEKDMNSIFITRKTHVEPEVVPLKSNVTNIESDPSANDAPESVPTFKSKMSMNDYFAMKLKKKSGNKESLLCNEETEDLEDSSPKEEFSSKKRKRELKSIPKISKKLKTLKSEDSENVQATSEEKVSCENGTEEEFSFGNISPVSKKEKKNKKSKLEEKLTNLKSCLKSTFSTNLWFKEEKKEVSFNESISYKIIENVLNKDDETDYFDTEINGQYTMDSFEEDLNSVEDDQSLIKNETEEISNYEHLNNVSDDVFMNYEVEDSRNESSVELEEGEIAPDEDFGTPQCFDLPKCDKSNFNTWLESQRIATKMKVYKNMAKKFRKDPVLKTSNLFDIKGYGNWGL